MTLRERDGIQPLSVEPLPGNAADVAVMSLSEEGAGSGNDRRVRLLRRLAPGGALAAARDDPHPRQGWLPD